MERLQRECDRPLLEIWEKTRSSPMWPWPVRMVSTRWFSLHQAPSFWKSWEETNIPTPWSTWGGFSLKIWLPLWNSSIVDKPVSIKEILTPSWLWLRTSRNQTEEDVEVNHPQTVSRDLSRVNQSGSDKYHQILSDLSCETDNVEPGTKVVDTPKHQAPTNTDIESLNRDVKAMMTLKEKEYMCKMCGKKGSSSQMRSHIGRNLRSLWALWNDIQFKTWVVES